MPGRSTTVASIWLRILPSFRSTVTPGKLPTCWLEPVSWLNRVVLPQFWLPARANTSGVPSGMAARPCSSSRWRAFISPAPGCTWGAWRSEWRGLTSGAGARSSAISMFSASARRRVSSYPRSSNSTGSPIGAVLRRVTAVPGVSPISSRWRRSAPVPPTARMVAQRPTESSLNFIFVSRSLFNDLSRVC